MPPERFSIGTPADSELSQSDGSTGSWELVSSVPPSRGPPSVPGGPEAAVGDTARVGCGPWALLLWTILVIVRDPPELEADFEEEGALEALMPVEAWSRRFYRQGATEGRRSSWCAARRGTGGRCSPRT